MAFVRDHSAFLLNAEGRALRFTLVDSDRLEGKYLVWQQLQDVEDLNDWAVYFTVDLAQSKLAGVPVLTLEQIDEIYLLFPYEKCLF